MAHNCGLPSISYGPFWGIVAHIFWATWLSRQGCYYGLESVIMSSWRNGRSVYMMVAIMYTMASMPLLGPTATLQHLF